MFWQRVRFAILAGLVLATAIVGARAQDDKKVEGKEKIEAKPAEVSTGKVPTPATAQAPAAHVAAAPCTTTVWVNELVPEYYETTRTTYRTEYRDEVYTSYRTEMVPETYTRTVMVSKTVPTVVDEVKTVTEYVPTCETRTGYKTEWQCREVTYMKKKWVDQGHYVCKEVECGPSLSDRFKKMCDPCYCPCPRTKTVKEWCPNKVCIEEPCTKVERFCVKVPYTYTVNVCKPVCKQIVCKVTKCVTVCEPRVETCTRHICKQIPVQCTRKVAVCVPVCEKVTACRMVCKKVAKEVPVTTCSSCCEPEPCCEKGGFFSRLWK